MVIDIGSMSRQSCCFSYLVQTQAFHGQGLGDPLFIATLIEVCTDYEINPKYKQKNYREKKIFMY